MHKHLKKLTFLLALLALLVINPEAFAEASAVETAMTTAVTGAKSAGEAVLAVAATVVAGFLIFKLAKRAAGKA